MSRCTDVHTDLHLSPACTSYSWYQLRSGFFLSMYGRISRNHPVLLTRLVSGDNSAAAILPARIWFPPSSPNSLRDKTTSMDVHQLLSRYYMYLLADISICQKLPLSIPQGNSLTFPINCCAWCFTGTVQPFTKVRQGEFSMTILEKGLKELTVTQFDAVYAQAPRLL